MVGPQISSEETENMSTIFPQPSHWSPISMNLQRDAMVLKASPVSHRVRQKLWAVLHSAPELLTC